MSTFISVKPDVKGKTMPQLVEYIYTLARSAGYTRSEALATIEKDLEEWVYAREGCWERLAHSQAARNEQLRIHLISIRDRLTAALAKDGE